MTTHARSTTIAVLLTAGDHRGCLTAAGCFGWNQAKFTREIEVSFVLAPGAGIAAETGNGAIELAEALREDVLVRASVRATTQERADAVQIVAQTDAPEWLEIRAVWPGQRSAGEGVSFVIEAPGGGPVRATTGNGELVVAGFAGGAELTTSNGAVTVTDHEGRVGAETSNGEITVLQAGGPVHADTSNGAVRVELADGAAGPVDIDTSNGGVTLVVGPGFSGRIEADTSNGAVRTADETGIGVVRILEDGRRSKIVQMGQSEQQSRIQTSNGEVRITVRK